MFYRVSLLCLLLIVSAFANIDFDEIKTFKADFVQTITNESSKKISYEGRLFIKNSGKVLWQYIKPIKKDVYMVGQNVIIVEPELEQVIFTSLEKNIDMVTLLKEAQKVNDNLYTTKLYDVEYFIQIKEDDISKIYFKDELSNQVEIDFSNSEKNTEIEDSFFLYSVPEYYDIIEK